MTPGDARTLAGHQLGAYLLEAPLPIGGLAECFRARHVELGREVAVTLLSGTLTGGRETLQRLRDEARRVTALKHPNILPIYGIAEAQNILFAVTPLPRESLRDRLDREGVLTAASAVQLAAQLAWALHALHSIGLVHGDVRPGTLLFDGDGTLNLADFGAARAFVRQRGRRVRSASPMWRSAGARTYLAPEVIQTGEISVRGDIYALGAVLYEMLIGALPRQQALLGEPETVTAPLPPSMRSSDTWPEIADVALKALERDPARRYADARAFAIALRRAVVEQPEGVGRRSLLDALSGVWHPEAEEAAGAGEAAAFKKKLATLPPTPTHAAALGIPSFKEKLAGAPATPPSKSASQQSAYKASAPPATPPSAVPPASASVPPSPSQIEQIATQQLPDRPPLQIEQIATQRLPDPPMPPIEQIATQQLPPPARARPAPPVTPPQQPVKRPPRFPPPSVTAGPGGTLGTVSAPAIRPAGATVSGPDATDRSTDDAQGYVSPAEMARLLAGQRPGRLRRITAASAGMVLLLVFGAGTAGILTGFGHGRGIGLPAGQPAPTATVAASATATFVPATATTAQHPKPSTRPTATSQLTVPPHHTATSRPTTTPTSPPTPTPTPSPTPAP